MKDSTQTKHWLNDVNTPDAPEFKPVRELRRELKDIAERRNKITQRRLELERLKQKAWCKAVDSITVEALDNYIQARDKYAAFYEAEKELYQISGSAEDQITNHASDSGEVLLPALELLAQRTAETLAKYQAAEHEHQRNAGLEPSDSPSLNPIKSYLTELQEALSLYESWGDGMTQSYWKRFNHLVKL